MKHNFQPSTFNLPRSTATHATSLDVESGTWSVGFSHRRSAANRRRWMAMFALLAALFVTFPAASGGVRLRDMVMVSGARDNQLVGYGLVAGLAGDGDKDPIYTKQTIAN